MEKLKEKIENVSFLIRKETIKSQIYCTSRDYVGELILPTGERIKACLDVNYYDGDGCLKIRISQGSGSPTNYLNCLNILKSYLGEDDVYDEENYRYLLKWEFYEDYHRFPVASFKTYVNIPVSVI